MQKINVYANDAQVSSKEDMPAWDGSVIMVGRIPCVGEFVRPSPDSPSLVVASVVHYVNKDTGTVAGVVLQHK